MKSIRNNFKNERGKRDQEETGKDSNKKARNRKTKRLDK